MDLDQREVNMVKNCDHKYLNKKECKKCRHYAKCSGFELCLLTTSHTEEISNAYV